MEESQLRYLHLLNAALSGQVVPAVSGAMAAHTGMVCSRLLSRILVTAEQWPVLHHVAVASWLGMTDVMQPLLPHEVFDSLVVALMDERNPSAIEQILTRTLQHLAHSDHPDAASIRSRLVAIDAELREGIEAAYAQLIFSQQAGSEDSSPKGLSEAEQLSLIAFIATHLPAESAVKIVRQTQVPGGFSKQTVIFELEGNQVLPKYVVMRRDGVYLPSGNSVTFEFPILKTLHDAGVAVPQPFLLDSKGSALERPFMIVAKVDGCNFGDSVEVTEPSRALGLDLARQMAALHEVEPALFGDQIPGANISTATRLRTEIESDLRKWNALGTPSFVVSGAFDWLLYNMDRAEGPRALVHRDIGAHNMLVQNDRVMALLDWELPVIGSPAEDVGYVADMVRQMMPLEEFLAAYNAAAQRPIDPHSLEFYDLWASLRLTVLIGGARQGVLAGQLHDVKLAYVSEHFAARLMQRLSNKLLTRLN